MPTATSSQLFEELSRLRDRVAELEADLEAQRSGGTSGDLCAELLQMVLDRAPVILWAIDAEGVFTLSKGQGLSVLHLEPGEVVGRSIFDLYKHHPQVLYWVRRALRGEELRSTVELEGVHVDCWYWPIRDRQNNVVGVRGVATVITRQVQAEKALRASEEAYRKSQRRYETLARMAPVGIVHFDPAGNAQYVNEQWSSVTGLSPKQARGYGWVSAIHSQDRLRVLQEWDRAVREEKPFCSEFRFRRPDGITTWVLGQAEPERDVSGKVTSYVGTITGIDDQKQVEEAQRWLNIELETRIQKRTEELRKFDLTLQEQIHERKRVFEELLIAESRWKSVVEGAPDTILIVDPDGTVQYVNRSIPPFGREEIVGKTVFDLIPQDYHDRMRQLIRSVLQTGESVTDELIAGSPDGTQAWYSSRIGAVKPGKKVVALTIVSRDITRQKRMEEESRQRQQELARVARLSTMGELGAMLAHELNQPLAAIVNYAAGCLRRFQSGEVDPDALLEVLEGIGKQARRAGETIDSIQRFVKPHEFRQELLPLNELVEEAVSLAQLEARRNDVTITADYAPCVPLMVGDRVQIVQVLLNLIINAVEAVAQCEPADRAVRVRTMVTADGDIGTRVSDAGPGLPDGFEEWIFEPFRSTKPDGLGMGLSISQSIVKAHGGRLWAKRGRGRGAEFCLQFPRWPGDRSS